MITKMYVVKYDDIEVSAETRQLRKEIIDEVMPPLSQQYGFSDDPRTAGKVHLSLLKLDYVLTALSDDLSGKTILDLGCGYNPSEEEKSKPSYDRIFEPWLCRALHHLNVKVIGIDLGDLDGELFEHYQLDLSHQDLPRTLQDNPVDLAHSYQMFVSPETSPSTGKSAALKRRLIPQLEQVVKEEGSFIYFD